MKGKKKEKKGNAKKIKKCDKWMLCIEMDKKWLSIH